MAKIGTFSRRMHRRRTDIEEGDVVAKWESDDDEIVVVTLAHDDGLFDREYWVLSDGPETEPHTETGYKSKTEAKDAARHVMREMSDTVTA